MLGKLVHLGFDALLISAFLAGVKRSTGLTCVPSFVLNIQETKTDKSNTGIVYQSCSLSSPKQRYPT